jgi:hypothetical protein
VNLSASTTCHGSGPEIDLSFSLSGGTESTFDLYRNGALYSPSNIGTTFSNYGSNVVAGQTYSYYVVVHLTSGATVTSTPPVSVMAPTTCAVPVISVTPGSQPFGSVAVGSSASLPFTVTNAGSGTLSGSAGGVSAPFSVVSGGTYNLSAGASQTVTVSFSPTAAQSYTENVTFTGGTGVTRTVTGTGTQAATVNLSASTTCHGSGPEIDLSFSLSGGTESTFDLYRNGALYSPSNIGTTFSNYGSKVVAGQTYSYYVVVHLTSGATVTSTPPVSVMAPTTCN